MERRCVRSTTARIQERQDGGSTLFGHAAVYYDGSPETQFELWPGVVERIMPRAFDRAVKEDDVRALFNHDPSMVLGRKSAKTLSLSADSRGLGYEISLGESSVAKDTRDFVRRGEVTGSSFSFITTDERWVKEEGLEVRQILGVQLFDVGPVTFPAYEGTTAGARGLAAVAAFDDAKRSREAWVQKVVARGRAEANLRRLRMLRTQEVDEAEALR